MEHYLDVTDPQLVVVEMDIYWAHVAQHQHRWRYDDNGESVEEIFDPLATVAKQTQRYPLYHAKDGDRTAEPPGVGEGYAMVPFGDSSKTSTTPGSSGGRAPRARTTRTTSRTTPRAELPIRVVLCGSRLSAQLI